MFVKGLYATISIWNDFLGGFNNAIDFCTRLANRAGYLLTSSWSTSYLVSPSLCTTFMCIRLPNSFVANVLNVNSIVDLSYNDAEIVQNYQFNEHMIEVPVKCIQGDLYVRVSCHVYNCIGDYEHLARVVLEKI